MYNDQFLADSLWPPCLASSGVLALILFPLPPVTLPLSAHFEGFLSCAVLVLVNEILEFLNLGLHSAVRRGAKGTRRGCKREVEVHGEQKKARGSKCSSVVS